MLPIIIKPRTSRLGIAILTSSDFLYMFPSSFRLRQRCSPLGLAATSRTASTASMGCRPASNECLPLRLFSRRGRLPTVACDSLGERAGCAGPLPVALDGGNYSAMDRVPHKLRVGGDAQLCHDPGLVKPNSSVGDLQNVSNFLQRPPFCQHLQDFTLAVGKLFWAM